MTKIHFRPYNPNQTVLFPQRIDEDIAENDPVRMVDALVESLNLESFRKLYKECGRSPYHPQMMLKVILYAYMNNIYSCRKIEKLLHRDIHYIWLAGYEKPDFITINRFRNRVKKEINEVFTQTVLLLSSKGFISLNVEYIDGTKIESKANKYTFVWRKTVERNRERLMKKIHVLLGQIDDVIAQENSSESNEEIEFTPAMLTEMAGELRQVLEQVPEPSTKEEKTVLKKKRKQLKELEEHRDKLQEYDNHPDTLQDRNSYSKTDNDATFMRMKEDAMRNGQTKPGYNLQIGTENQFITDFALFPNPTDTLTLIPFLQSFSNRYDRMAHTVVADSGYGSEENYRFMSENGMEAYVKYNYFHMEQRPRFKPDPFKAENFYYNEEHDYCICPMGQRMRRIGTGHVKTASGYVSENARYRAVRCEGCPLRCRCFKAKGNRTIELNHRLRRYRQKAKELLCSKEGLKHRGQRCIEPEAVFGQIKNNMNYKRFRHFGKDKVFMDFSFLAIAFNIKKMCAKMTKEGMDWLIRLFYELTAALFKCRKHINQRNLQNIAA
ncbi:IS1182 family transposase [Bacteroides heparinolyticus]|uniref:IS1182 family transposase n=1 Tax=Prevotella heparinolytica TaxID=28113 RepID=UPI00359FF8C2